MIKLEMENYNTVLTERQQRFQYSDHEKLINMNILLGKILPSTHSKIMKQTKFIYSPLGKNLEKQTKKQANAL